MDRARLQRLRACFALFQPCGPALVARVMLNLSRSDPAAYALFPRDSSGEANARLWKSLERIVTHIGEFGKIEDALVRFGARAAAAGATPAHFASIRAELIGTMRELAGHDWNPRLHEDWELALAAVCGAMMRGGAPTMRRAA